MSGDSIDCAKKGFGEPCRQSQERQLDQVMVGTAQPGAQHLHQPKPGVRIAAKGGQDITPIQNGEGAGGQRRGIGAARLPVEHCNFAEYVPCVNNCEYELLAVCGRDADPDLAVENGDHAVMQVSHPENGVAGTEAADVGTGNERVSVVRCKFAKQGTIAEQSTGVFQIGGHLFSP